MAELDFNSVLDDIFLIEEKHHEESYQEGFQTGVAAGNPEGYHLGYHRGAEIGKELGYYYGVVRKHLTDQDKLAEKLVIQLQKVKELIDAFPRDNSEEHDILGMLEAIRAQYKKACALLKIPSNNPYQTSLSF